MNSIGNFGKFFYRVEELYETTSKYQEKAANCCSLYSATAPVCSVALLFFGTAFLSSSAVAAIGTTGLVTGTITIYNVWQARHLKSFQASNERYREENETHRAENEKLMLANEELAKNNLILKGQVVEMGEQVAKLSELRVNLETQTESLSTERKGLTEKLEIFQQQAFALNQHIGTKSGEAFDSLKGLAPDLQTKFAEIQLQFKEKGEENNKQSAETIAASREVIKLFEEAIATLNTMERQKDLERIAELKKDYDQQIRDLEIQSIQLQTQIETMTRLNKEQDEQFKASMQDFANERLRLRRVSLRIGASSDQLANAAQIVERAGLAPSSPQPSTSASADPYSSGEEEEVELRSSQRLVEIRA